MSTKFHFNHIAFSDDSRHENGRFHSLSLLTFPNKFEADLRRELILILKDSGIEREFKWNKVTDAKYKFAAEKIYTYIFKNLDKIRLDILIWDMQDSRHSVSGRDDSENLCRMYYHLVGSTLSRRWGEDAEWLWKPDQQSGVDWEELGNFIVNKKHDVLADIFGINQNSFLRLKIKAINPVDSHKEIFVQIADYFAGIGAYSYGHFERYARWKETRKQTSLFKDENIETFSKSEIVRFNLIDLLDTTCKTNKLGVSLNTNRGFFSYNPDCAINFWLYSPQSVLDRAPTT